MKIGRARSHQHRPSTFPVRCMSARCCWGQRNFLGHGQSLLYCPARVRGKEAMKHKERNPTGITRLVKANNCLGCLGFRWEGGCRTGLRITLVQLPLMLITSAWGRGKEGDSCFEKRGVEGGRVCNITRLAILGLTTGHGYRRLPVTTSYPSTAAAPSPSSCSDSSVWEAVPVWHDGQC